MKKLLTIIAISALTLSTLVGCGKKDEPTVVEPTATVETTVESTETVEPTSSNTIDTEETRSTKNQEVEEVKNEADLEKEVVIDLPADEYYIDYPMTFEDTIVCIKINDNIHFNADTKFYPDKETTAEDYFNETGIMCFSLTDTYLFQPKIKYVLNPEATIDDYKNDNFTVTEISNYTNMIYILPDVNYIIIEYKVNDMIFQVTIEDNNGKLTDTDKKMLMEYYGENIPFEIVK